MSWLSGFSATLSFSLSAIFLVSDLLIEPNRFLKILEKIKAKNKIIGGYYSYNYEINTLDILKKLEKKNYKISLPKINKNNQMNFFDWSFKDPLLINIFGWYGSLLDKKSIKPSI